MYKLRYYLTGGTLVSKTFNTFSEAMNFWSTKVPFNGFYSLDKIEEANK